MGTYAESLLADGEVIVMRQRQHWLSLLSAVRTAIALWIIAVVLVALLAFLKNTDDLVKNVVGGITTIAVVVGVVVFFWNWWHWQTEEYLVTNRRLLKVSGIINKESGDSSLEKINDAVLQQSMFGRIFDYGDLEIMTAAELTISKMRFLKDSVGFKKDMLNAKHELELELSGGGRPTPPLRAPATFQVPPPAAAAAPPAAVPTGQAPRASAAVDAEDVTETLARLADLRDRGTITPAEFEQKKAELLSRL